MQTIQIRTATEYQVLIGHDILEDAGRWSKELGSNYKKVAIITDSNVAPLYGESIIKSYISADYLVECYIFPAGERSKSMDDALKIISWLREKEFTRSDLLVALGGGVCGDLVGFVASIYLRGVDFIQIPTTFLSAIDSSVGGKTAVNIPEGKNLVGTFWQPKLVVCDTATLSTLSKEDFNSGVAEAIKYGCIWDKTLFDTLSSKEWMKTQLEDVIGRCVEIKAEVVSQDEKELGIRAILNWGHTIGHAIEKLSRLQVSHGYGVAIGMVMFALAGEIAGTTKAGTAKSIAEALSVYDIPSITSYSYEELANACLGDKKRSGDNITLVTLKEIGQYALTPMPVDQLLSFIKGGD